jgi:steroid delta-isomerase-like uncharacterized protein
MSQASIDAARSLVEAFNDADWGRFDALLAPDSIYDEVGTGRTARGAAEVVELYKGWKQAMPDAQGTVTNAIDAGDTAVLEVTWNGTFTGQWATPQGLVEPTGKHQTSRACIVNTVADGKVKESHQYFDSMSLMQQLGLLGEPASV